MREGFNIIDKKNPDLFDKKVSILGFIRMLNAEEKLPRDFAVVGLDALLYYAENREETARYIRRILENAANLLATGHYIIQVVMEGDLYVVESFERPRVRYNGEEIHLNPVFGRVRQLDVNYFLAPLNIQS